MKKIFTVICSLLILVSVGATSIMAEEKNDEGVEKGYWYVKRQIDSSVPVSGVVKIQIKGGEAHKSTVVKFTLKSRGVSDETINQFIKEFNELTTANPDYVRYTYPVVITVYRNGKINFVIKTPPTAHTLLKIGYDRNPGKPNDKKIGPITVDDLRKLVNNNLQNNALVSVASKASNVIRKTATNVVNTIVNKGTDLIKRIIVH